MKGSAMTQDFVAKYFETPSQAIPLYGEVRVTHAFGLGIAGAWTDAAVYFKIIVGPLVLTIGRRTSAH